MKKHQLYLCFVLITFLWPSVLAAQPSAPGAPWEAPAFSAPPKDIMAAAALVKPERYATVTIFSEERHVTFDSAERALQTSRLFYRIEAKDALVNWGTVKANWSPWRQKRPVVRARVIAPDGAVAMLDPSVLTESPVHDQRPAIYEDQRALSGPLPGVVIGSVVETEITWEDTAPITTHGSLRRFLVGNRNPTLRTLLELKAPSSVHFLYKVRNAQSIKVTRSEEGGMVAIRFEQGSLPPVESFEPDLPSDAETWPSIDYATGESWASVAEGYYKDIESAIRPQDVQPLLEGTKGLKGIDLLRRVVTNLHQKVRYTGLEYGASALIPHPAGETLKSSYGDCKDKAVVLVSALKAAGTPAVLALLRTRGDDDINPETPGLGMFDHAIVHIPGKPGVWIDATSEFLEPDSLPWVDQGRRALLIGPGTRELITTPINRPQDNARISRREFRLSEYGPALISETFLSTGNDEAGLRARYGQEETKELREGLESYAKNAFLAEGLDRIEHTSGTDLTRQFALKLEVGKGRRGLSDLETATVAIRVDGLIWGYPNYVLSDDGTDKPDQPGWKPRSQVIEVQPFSTDWHYQIIPPPGFEPPVLPQDVERQLGPAKLVQHYTLEKDATVRVDWHFDSGKARYTPAELKELRQAVHQLTNADVPTIDFHQKGAVLLSQGKAREALKVFSDLIQAHPGEALHHVQMANALLAAGFGEEARKEARRATELEPKEALGWGALAWILEHDAIGRRFMKGFDLEGGIAAYRKAIELKPKEWGYYADLAILLEHDSFGDRYSAKAKLDEAIAQYRALKQADPNFGDRFDDNLLFALFYARKFDDLLHSVAALPPNSTRSHLKIAAIAARDGSQAALAEAVRIESRESVRSGLLVSAGNMLVQSRSYSRAVDLFKAAVGGQEDSSKLAARIEMMSTVRPFEEGLLPASDPQSVVQQYYLYLFDEKAKPEDFFRFVESDAADRKDDARRMAQVARLWRAALDRDGLPPAQARDYMISNLRLSKEGDDKTGYRIRALGLGENPQTMLVVRTAAGYRILAIDDDAGMAGKEVLRRIAAQDYQGAKLWLDWVREEQTFSAGDDPLAGRLFPRFWTRGDSPDPKRMRLAALALLSGSNAIGEYLEELKAARAQAQSPDALRLDLLLANAAGRLKNWPLLQEAALRLVAGEPSSNTALDFVNTACAFTHDWKAWQTVIAARLARVPDDRAAIRASAGLAEAQGDFTKARSILRPLIDKNQAEMRDYNQYTWLALFLDKVTNDELSLLQRAIAKKNDSSYAEIHTLACLYAELGKTKEARELLLRAMDSVGIDEPNEPIWFGFARIAEEYGLASTALSLYQRVGRTDVFDDIPTSTFLLARMHEKRLSARAAPSGSMK